MSGMEEGDHLYLLEVVVEDVKLDLSRRCATGPLKVSFHFLNFPAIEINKDGPTSCTQEPSERVVETVPQEEGGEEVLENDQSKKSKSLMFPMCPEKLTSKIGMIPLTVNVFGKECAELPPSILGTSKVYLTEAFMEAISLAKSQVMLPVTATLEEAFPLRDVFGENTGTVSVYVRLSCFGATAITTDGVMKEKTRTDFDLDMWQKPLITCEETVMTCGNDEPPCLLDLKRPVPWRLVSETPKMEGRATRSTAPNAVSSPGPSSPYVRPQPFAKQQPSKKDTAVCTCDQVPDILLPGPQPPAIQQTKCECADILAALRNCQQSLGEQQQQQQQQLQGSMAQPAQQMDASSPVSATPVTGTPFAAPTQLSVQLPSNPVLNNYSVPEPGSSKMSEIPAMAPPSVLPTAPPFLPPAPPADIVPTSEVCGMDLKSKNTKSRNSEDKVVVSKQEVKELKNASNTEPLGNEESARKVLEQEVVNWDTKKKSIQKEVRKKKKTKNIYDYTAGMYPGMVIGHKYCIPTLRLVPRNMGWLWNILELQGKNRGWMPGAITKTVTSNFGHWKKAAGLHGDDIDAMGASLRKKKRAQQRGSVGGEKSISTGTAKPSLHVHKKDGYYYITVHPAGGDLPPGTKPLSFKVDPKKASSDEMSSDETSENSFEFEYMTPAALQPPKRIVEKSTDATQYCEADFLPKKKGEVQVTVEESKKEETESSKKSKPKSKKEKKGKKDKKAKGKKK